VLCFIEEAQPIKLTLRKVGVNINGRNLTKLKIL